MTEAELIKLFAPLWNDANTEHDYPAKRPVLAHYTSIQTLESIFKSGEIWMSNPLLMNDTEELAWGLTQAKNALEDHKALGDTIGTTMHRALVQNFYGAFENFNGFHAFDTYVGSLSEHDVDDQDGLLSMWRGYGGNGSGAAVLIDTSVLVPPEGQSPILLGRVHYGTSVDRKAWIVRKIDEFCQLIASPDVIAESLAHVATMLFNRFLLMALFSKHRGFSEEKEWRVVYLSYLDRNREFSARLWYLNGERGVEPKFRLPLSGLPERGSSVTTDDLVKGILLGPTASSSLSVASVSRMLHFLNRSALAGRVKASSIPFRR